VDRLDLHLHSNYSDGENSVSDLLKKVFKAGVQVCSVTDHDSLDQVKPAFEYGTLLGLEMVAGIELSTFFEGGEVHVLGYGFDAEDSGLRAFVEEQFARRQQRVQEMVQLLNEMGVALTYEDVLRQSPGPYVGRPHIAKAMIEKGFIRSMGEAFSLEYIGNFGKAYLPPEQTPSEEAVQIIQDAGGISVLAHPGLFFSTEGQRGMSRDQLLFLQKKGLRGIEVYHSRHSLSQVQEYLSIARKHGFGVTLGSDYHYGPYFPIFPSIPVQIREEAYEWLKG